MPRNLRDVNLETLSDEDWKEITFRNSIHFHRSELLRIMHGERATTVIPMDNTRTGLRFKGILEQRYGRDGKEIVISVKALRILKGEEP